MAFPFSDFNFNSRYKPISIRLNDDIKENKNQNRRRLNDDQDQDSLNYLSRVSRFQDTSFPLFGPVQRPQHSIFNPAPGFQISGALGECWLIEEILNSPCSVRLLQSRYYEIISEYTITLRPEPRSITYSVINTIMTHLVEHQSEAACAAGRIQLYLFGNPDSKSTQDNVVISEATDFNVKIPRRCNYGNKNTNLIYIPLGIQWISSAKALKQAQTQGPDFNCQGNCDSGHAMAIIINNADKSIDLFEPNGRFVPWYKPVEEYLSTMFDSEPKYKDYVFNDIQACLPNRGIQAIAQKPQYAYFANLYAALRLLCPELTPPSIIQSLLALNKKGLLQLLQRFHCFLVNYAQENGIFSGIEYMLQLYNQVHYKMINFRNYSKNAKHNKAYYADLIDRAEDLAFNDIFAAIRVLRRVDKQLVK